MSHIAKYQHPEWALAHRKPGIELRFINNKYYLNDCPPFGFNYYI